MVAVNLAEQLLSLTSALKYLEELPPLKNISDKVGSVITFC